MEALPIVAAAGLLFGMAASALCEESCAQEKWNAGTVKEESGGITFYLTIPEKCLQGGCGLIIDLAGQNMSADAENLGTKLRDLVTTAAASDPKRGFVLIQAGGSGVPRSWRFQDPPAVYDYASCVIQQLKLSPKALHIGGFSQGAHIAALLFCAYPERFASAALLAGGANVAAACLTGNGESTGAGRSLLYVHGTSDTVVPSKQAERLVERLKSAFEGDLKINQVNAQETEYSAKSVFVDMILHSYSGGFTGGHCMPGGEGPVGCEADLKIGEKILDFYVRHPRTK